MPEKSKEIVDLELALKESLMANKDNAVMSDQLSKILAQQEDQGKKINTIYGYFEEDPIRGSKGVLIEIKNLKNEVKELQVFNMIIKKQALLVSAISSFFVSIIVGVTVFFITKSIK